MFVRLDVILKCVMYIVSVRLDVVLKCVMYIVSVRLDVGLKRVMDIVSVRLDVGLKQEYCSVNYSRCALQCGQAVSDTGVICYG